MKAYEIHLREQERLGRMKAAEDVKKEREQKLARMTAEEKQEFLEEEKEQKKQEWAKKRVKWRYMALIDMAIFLIVFSRPVKDTGFAHKLFV